MKCENKAEQWVESGYHGKMVEIPCGMTGIHGQVVLCDDCLVKANEKYPQGWTHRPGDTCIHGVYLNPNYDCNCYKCEDGVGREYDLLCYCGIILQAPLGWELDCDDCGTGHTVPETEEELTRQNSDVAKELQERQYTGKIRIMRTDECGHDTCVLTVDDDDAAQYTIAGVTAAYPESKVFTERELNMQFAVDQFIIHNEN